MPPSAKIGPSANSVRGPEWKPALERGVEVALSSEVWLQQRSGRRKSRRSGSVRTPSSKSKGVKSLLGDDWADEEDIVSFFVEHDADINLSDL